MSPCVRCRVVAAASRSITWNGGTFALLATSNRSVMSRAYGCGFRRSAAETRRHAARRRRVPGLWLSAAETRSVPPRASPEERPLAELGAGAVALAVLGEVRGAGAGGVQPGDDRAVGA